MEVGRLTLQDGCCIGGRWSNPWRKRVKRAISLFWNSWPLLKNEQLVQFLQFRPLKNIIYKYLRKKTIFKKVCNFVQFIAIFLKLKTPNCTNCSPNCRPFSRDNAMIHSKIGVPNCRNCTIFAQTYILAFLKALFLGKILVFCLNIAIFASPTQQILILLT